MSILKHDVLALSDGIARCDVVPQAGGAIAGFWWECGERRIDWLRPARAADVARADAAKMAAYPLVPWGGRIRDGSFHFGGEEVAEGCDALNGHGWRRSWRVVGRSATEVALEYRHDGGSWPWPYRARQTIALADGALSLTLDLANESDRLMPAGLGFLSAFPFASEASLEAAVQGVWPEDGAGTPREGRAVPSSCELAARGRRSGRSRLHRLGRIGRDRMARTRHGASSRGGMAASVLPRRPPLRPSFGGADEPLRRCLQSRPRRRRRNGGARARPRREPQRHGQARAAPFAALTSSARNLETPARRDFCTTPHRHGSRLPSAASTSSTDSGPPASRIC